MARIERIRVALTGFAGAPGVSTFYAINAASMISPLNTFYSLLAGALPNDVTATVQNTGDVIEATTGALVDTWTGPVQPPTVGANAGTFASPSGATVSWLTPAIMDGHRLKGRTFLVPLGGNSYDTDGSLDFGVMGSIGQRAAELVAASASNFVVWHRPFAGRAATPTSPARPAFSGAFAFVTGYVVPEKVAVLRSRRD